MSRTDKHRPWPVQIVDPQNKVFLREVHDHRRGVCDINEGRTRVSQWFGRWSNCYLSETRYAYYAGGMWAKRPRKGGWGRPKRRDGKARASLRQLSAQVRQVHRAHVYYSWPLSVNPDWEDLLPDWGACEPTQRWLWNNQD